MEGENRFVNSTNMENDPDTFLGQKIKALANDPEVRQAMEALLDEKAKKLGDQYPKTPEVQTLLRKLCLLSGVKLAE